MGIPVLFAPAVGPVLSGWLVEYHSWRWIFLINIPVGIISLILSWFKLPKVEKQSTSQLNLLGIIFSPLAFAALSYGISQDATSWTSDKTLIGLIGGAIALLIFVIVELRARVPLLELRVFKSPDFSIGRSFGILSQIK